MKEVLEQKWSWRIKFKWSIAIVISLLLGDMLVGGSIDHPLTYIYRGVSWFLCLSDCPFDRAKSISRDNETVVTSHHLATNVGLRILQNGGNAIDAAVAVGYALAVVYPCCGNLGGGGFMLIQLADGKEIFVNFREIAPSKATADMFAGKKQKLSREGYLAVAVPGTVKGLEYALAKFGTMPREKILAEAIDLAKNGFVLEKADLKLLKFAPLPLKNSVFAGVKGVGDRLIQPELAKTLQEISQKGESVFYRGSIGASLVRDSQQNGGILSLQDLANYRIKERVPLKCSYRGYEVITAPPPGGGVTLCQMLNILEGYPAKENRDVTQLHRRLASMLFAYRDRNQYLGDPDFVTIPTSILLSKDYARSIRSNIGTKAIEPKSINADFSEKEGQHTTHYSIIDRYGNAVAVTYTLNSYFGAGVVNRHTGIILNNEMDDFTTQVGKPNQFGLIQSQTNQIEPGKQPASSMSPTIVKKDGKVVLVTGSPGGSTIPTTVLQVILGVIDEGKDIATAVNSSRIHYQGQPNIVISEPFALSSQEFQQLWDKGYKVVPFFFWGAAESIQRDRAGKIWEGRDRRKS